MNTENKLDKLDTIFDQRLDFMKLIESKFPGSYPEIPVNISYKESQRICREIALKGVEEMFEALQHLKNWKPHRETEIPEINREEFLEEIVDAFNYFFSLMILIDVNVDEFFEAFCKKDKVIRERIKTKY
tara:strand:- start:657 stop:1046 length:390 start_codon:yes stop_codon:yes gene_type:complete